MTLAERFSLFVKGVIASLAAALIASLGWSYAGRPHDLPDVATPNGKMHCASYAPFRGAETPFDPGYRVSKAQLETDLDLLARKFECLRIYSSDQGLDQVLPIARDRHLKVLLGAWIGRSRADNQRELARTVKLARDFTDVVEAVIVGNEVLLRGDLPKDELKTLIAETKQQIPEPVTYADVWEFWLKNPDLAGVVDFVTVHILPYWEDDPTPVEIALDHVALVLTDVQHAFPGKHIMIGETGWPSFGRMREGAGASLTAQAEYLRGIIAYARAHDLDYNLFSAFDEPWKERLEGRVGGHWGIFTGDRRIKQSLTGPVSDHPDWRRKAMISSILAFLLILTAIAGNAQASWRAILGLSPFAALCGAMLCEAAMDAPDLLFTVPELGGRVLACLLIAATATALSRHWVAAEFLGRPCYVDEVLAQFRGLRWPGDAELLGLLRGMALVGAAAVSLGLVFDSRYRSFPWEIYVVPALGFAIETWRQPRWATGHGGPVETVLCWLVIAGAFAVLALEGLSNLQATAWAVVSVLLGIRILAAGRF